MRSVGGGEAVDEQEEEEGRRVHQTLISCSWRPKLIPSRHLPTAACVMATDDELSTLSIPSTHYPSTTMSIPRVRC